MSFTVLVPLIDGFEEVEAFAAIDLLRRAQIETAIAGVERMHVVGSHQINTTAGLLLGEIGEREFNMVVLPGGPGASKLGRNEMVRSIIKSHAARGKWIGAICAAPAILADLGLLEGRRAACHPSVESEMHGALIVRERVVVDGNFITSRGVGTVLPFGLALVEKAAGVETARRIASAICLPEAAWPFAPAG